MVKVDALNEAAVRATAPHGARAVRNIVALLTAGRDRIFTTFVGEGMVEIIDWFRPEGYGTEFATLVWADGARRTYFAADMLPVWTVEQP